MKPAVCGILACNEPVGLCNPTFRGNNAPIESEIYLTENLESYRTMSLEPENLKHACRVSESVPIIPIVCGGGLAFPTSSKAAAGVVMNNKELYAHKMECVKRHREPLKSSNVSCASCVSYESVTT